MDTLKKIIGTTGTGTLGLPFTNLKSYKTMKYDIFSNIAPAMPKPSKGTECVSLLLSQASKDMREPLVPMIFPAFAAHLSEVKFMYCDNKWYDFTSKRDF
ncbi:MAG: hypothetical protein IK000_06570 [Bacteroidaceae bacterium]|nr:hypothetical protein [Bacteroidaceae bacterium]